LTGQSAPAVRAETAAQSNLSVEAADAVLGRLPSLAHTERHLELIPGGLTNVNFRVTTASGARYAARFSSPTTSLLAIDRAAEYQNSLLAEAGGVGPRIVEFVPAEGVRVVEWINGRTFEDDDLADPKQLDRVAQVCRQLHGGGRFVNDFDMFDVQRRYLSIVRSSGFRLPKDYLAYEPVVRRIEHVLRASSPGTVPCHNDLLAANIVDDGDRLWLIDYELSGNNDACFELGNIWSEAALEPDLLEYLVTAYFGRPAPVETARARLFGLMSKYGWTLWASIQDAVSDIAFDYWQWGMAKYVRAREEFRSPELEQLISTVQESIRS
jgi:thiamine kinase-like enzyme